MCKIDGSLFISLSFLVIISVPPRAGEAQRDWSHRGSALAQTEWYVSRRAWDQTGGPLFACHMCSDFACASELRYQIWWLIPWPFWAEQWFERRTNCIKSLQLYMSLCSHPGTCVLAMTGVKFSDVMSLNWFQMLSHVVFWSLVNSCPSVLERKKRQKEKVRSWDQV